MRKTISIILALFSALLLFGCGSKKAEQEYIDNIKAFNETTLEAAVLAEDLCNLTTSVWRNTIFEKDDPDTDPYTKDGKKFNKDFNTSLFLLSSAEEVEAKKATLSDYQNKVKAIYLQLQEPPEKLSNCYVVLDEAYDEFMSLSSLALNPTGSLESYSSAVIKHDTELVSKLDKLETLIPEE